MTQLRQRVLGQRSPDVVALQSALREICELLEQDVADLRRQEMHESGAVNDISTVQNTAQAGVGRAPQGSRPEAENLPAQSEHGIAHSGAAEGRSCAADPGARQIAEGADGSLMEAAENSGSDSYTLWGRKADPVHPIYAAVVVSCASYAWLVPAYLHELVLGLEQQMIELEAQLHQ